ncbi:MAG: hypothetical protein V7L01_22390 [Nostoc sp.]|uniref:hypothetical protein n=1 Tax=Nostoc sp. TaxID=1180 RepID=UPI002FFC283E
MFIKFNLLLPWRLEVTRQTLQVGKAAVKISICDLSLFSASGEEHPKCVKTNLSLRSLRYGNAKD